ncbi:MAG: metallophosphoesterase [Candidatus Poribacteria bacterium]|nr:metallophosphoesterase [Candidatus Poribacteria bacterium]
MKIGLISDLHTDVTPWNKLLVPHLIDAVKAAALDVLVIAGDIARHLVQLSETLNAFHLADLACEIVFVPGNHDIWAIETANVTSEQKCRIISELCSACGIHPLMDAPFVHEKVGFCGTIGWYDYSFARDGYDFSDAQYAEKELMGAVWNDKRYAKWNDADPRVARRFEAALGTQIAAIRNDVSRIVVVTHHVPFRRCIRYRGELPWDYFRAFMGSKGLGAQCLQEPLVTHALFGHTHQALDMQIDSVRAICAPVGYLHEKPTIALQAYAAQCLTCFEI